MTKPCPNCGCVRPNDYEQRYHNYRCGNVNYSILGLNDGWAWLFSFLTTTSIVLWNITVLPFWACVAIPVAALAGLYGIFAWEAHQNKLGKRD